MSVSVEKPVEAGGGAVDRRRRRWSEAQKRQIVAESREPGVSVSVVARRYNVNANQVFTWRRQYCEPEGDAEAGVEVGRVGRQEPELCAGAADRLADRSFLVASEVVEDDDVAWPQGGDEELFDPGLEALGIDRAAVGLPWSARRA